MHIARGKKKKSSSDKQIKKKENILTLLTLKMLTPLKRHRSGVYCISFKGCSGQGHVPPPLSPLNGKNLGRAWNHSWDLHWRVSLNHDGWLTSRLQKLILFSQLFRFGSIPTSYALGWRVPAAPPAAGAAGQLELLPAFRLTGEEFDSLTPCNSESNQCPNMENWVETPLP